MSLFAPWWALLACHHEEVGFPRRLAPLETNRAKWPSPDTEELSIVSGGDDDLWWAHAKGYVHASPTLVYAVLADPDVVVDRREVDFWEITPDTMPDFDRSFTVHNVVDDVITVDYDLTWVWEVQAGSEALPERIVAQWDKTDGTPFIDILRGSLVLESVEGEPDVTAIATIEQLKASLRDDAVIRAYLEDLHASIVAAAHGERLPEY